MTYLRIFVVTSMCVLLPTKIIAGIEVRNGGDLLVCAKEDGSETSELLDIFEARTFYHKTPKFDLSLSDIEIANSAFDRLATVDPERAERYKKLVSTFKDRVEFVPNFTIKDILDDGAIGVPKNCRLEQFAIQTNDPTKKKFIISEAIWDRASKFDRVMLIVHEIIYEEFIRFGEPNSINVRKLFAKLLDTDPVLEDRCAYVDYLRDLNDKADIVIDGVSFSVKGLELNESCSAKKGEVVRSGTFTYKDVVFAVSGKQVWQLHEGSYFPKVLKFTEVKNLQIAGCAILWPKAPNENDPNEVTFTSNGDIASLKAANGIGIMTVKFCQADKRPLNFLIQGKYGKGRGGIQVSNFYPNGQLKYGALLDFEQFKTVYGPLTFAGYNNASNKRSLTVSFHENGSIKNGNVAPVSSKLTTRCFQMRDGKPYCNNTREEFPFYSFDDEGWVLAQ